MNIDHYAGKIRLPGRSRQTLTKRDSEHTTSIRTGRVAGNRSFHSRRLTTTTGSRRHRYTSLTSDEVSSSSTRVHRDDISSIFKSPSEHPLRSRTVQNNRVLIVITRRRQCYFGRVLGSPKRTGSPTPCGGTITARRRLLSVISTTTASEASRANEVCITKRTHLQYALSTTTCSLRRLLHVTTRPEKHIV